MIESADRELGLSRLASVTQGVEVQPQFPATRGSQSSVFASHCAVMGITDWDHLGSGLTEIEACERGRSIPLVWVIFSVAIETYVDLFLHF